MDGYTFSFPISVEFGNGSSERVGDIADSKGWEKAMIVTDQGIIEAGILDGVRESLDSAGIEFVVYDEVQPNPTVDMVDDATDLLAAEDCDVVVAVGGGSSMDVGKTAAMMATNTRGGQRLRGEVGRGRDGRADREPPAPAGHRPHDGRDGKRGGFLGGDHGHRLGVQDGARPVAAPSGWAVPGRDGVARRPRADCDAPSSTDRGDGVRRALARARKPRVYDPRTVREALDGTRTEFGAGAPAPGLPRRGYGRARAHDVRRSHRGDL